MGGEGRYLAATSTFDLDGSVHLQGGSMWVLKTTQCKRTSLSSSSHIESGSLCGGPGDHRGPVRKRTYGKEAARPRLR